jgi:anthranilate synthase component 2
VLRLNCYDYNNFESSDYLHPSTYLPITYLILRQKILILDNYDSFTYNLVHLVSEVSSLVVDVYRNDAISLRDIGKYHKIILSPGPGLPSEAGILQAAIAQYAGKIPLLGVCLGLQAIGEVMGCRLKNLPQVQHGVQHELYICDPADPILSDLPNRFLAGRYHSWVIDKNTVANSNLQVSCVDAQGDIMAMYHAQQGIFGVQFHPESVMTPLGHCIMRRFLEWG